MTHSTFAVLDGERNLPTVPGRENRDFSIWDFKDGGKFYTIFPYFHVSYSTSLLIFSLSSPSSLPDSSLLLVRFNHFETCSMLKQPVNPIFTEASSPVLGPPFSPPSGNTMKEVLDQQKVRAVYIPPSIAEQLLQLPNGLNYFKNLDFVCYTGGPFSPSAGQKLTEVTDLVPLYGSTEAFQTPQLAPSKEDWAYMEWNPHFPHRMELADEPGVFELVLSADQSTAKISALNHNLPGVSEWRTKDLFRQHPSKPSLWQYYGRRDDIIVFSNGEKYNPVPAELLIGGSKLVTGALIIGSGRSQAGLLVEPKMDMETGDQETSLTSDIWPLVEQANLSVSGQGRISRSKIIIVPAGSFLRAGKGTVVRKLTEQKIRDKIEEMYSTAHIPTPLFKLQPDFDRESIERFVQNIVNDTFQSKIGLEDDFFTHGLDSLKSIEMLQALKGGIASLIDQEKLHRLSMDLIYRFSTGLQVAEALLGFLESGSIPKGIASSPSDLDGIVRKYVEKLPTSFSSEVNTDRSQSSQMAKTRQQTIALTGSTGSLSTVLLRYFSSQSDISKVHCINRRHVPDHENQFGDEVRAGRVEFHIATLSHFRLGLSIDTYNKLLEDVDIIVHNAWAVDFALPLHAFEQQLEGVQNLIVWANQSPRPHTKIVFVSSVSSVLNYGTYHAPSTRVPESLVSDPRAALTTGYAQSKFAAEQMIATASERCSVPSIILRLGQVVQAEDFSSLDGERAKHSWVPRLFKTSNLLGYFPENICDVDWLELEHAAAIVGELSMLDHDRSRVGKGARTPDGMAGLLGVVNIVNPRPASWSMLLPGLKKRGVLEVTTKPISLVEWVAKLRSTQLNQGLPAAELISFFESLGEGKQGVKFETECGRAGSKIFADLKPINEDVVARWT